MRRHLAVEKCRRAAPPASLTVGVVSSERTTAPPRSPSCRVSLRYAPLNGRSSAFVSHQKLRTEPHVSAPARPHPFAPPSPRFIPGPTDAERQHQAQDEAGETTNDVTETGEPND